MLVLLLLQLLRPSQIGWRLLLLPQYALASLSAGPAASSQAWQARLAVSQLDVACQQVAF
jgi:hypothetical protein